MSGETKELRGDAPADVPSVQQLIHDSVNDCGVAPEAADFVPVESVAIALSHEMQIHLFAQSIIDQTTIEATASKILKDWAALQAYRHTRLVQALMLREFTQPPEKKRNEKDVERQLVKDLIEAGIDGVRTQVKCANGVADVVTSDAVIEVKKNIPNWRILHLAMGQATSYAQSLGRSTVVVCAEEIAPKLVGKQFDGGVLLLAQDVASFLKGGRHG